MQGCKGSVKRGDRINGKTSRPRQLQGEAVCGCDTGTSRWGVWIVAVMNDSC